MPDNNTYNEVPVKLDNNGVNDEIRQQREKLKGKGFKYKFAYFWEYYRWATLGTIVGLIFLFSMVKSFVTAKQPAFQVIFMNAASGIESEEFAKIIEINEKKEEVLFNADYLLNLDPEGYDETSYINMQKVLAMASAKELDVILGYENIAEYYGKGEMLLDLRDLFGSQYIEELGDKVLWVDIEDDGSDELFPLAINVSDAPKLVANQCFPFGDAYFCVVGNTVHEEWVRTFYEYIYK